MSKPELNIAFVGNYSPRICGIATFTTDLCEATATQLGQRSHVFTVAINDTDQGYAYPPQVEFAIQRNQQGDYYEAANFINASNADVACVQHEYGIYGGWDGIYVLSLVSSLSVPACSLSSSTRSFCAHRIVRDTGRRSRDAATSSR